MKHILCCTTIFIIALLFSSCSQENPVESTPKNTIYGTYRGIVPMIYTYSTSSLHQIQVDNSTYLTINEDGTYQMRISGIQKDNQTQKVIEQSGYVRMENVYRNQEGWAMWFWRGQITFVPSNGDVWINTFKSYESNGNLYFDTWARINIDTDSYFEFMNWYRSSRSY
jgi:hypothetical protein